MSRKFARAFTALSLALALSACGSSNMDEQSAAQAEVANGFIGNPDSKPGNKSISFSNELVEGTDAIVHGRFEPNDLGEVFMFDGGMAMVLDEHANSGSYSGAGLTIPKMGVVEDESIALESQMVRYVETLQKAFLEQNIKSKSVNFVKTQSPVSPIVQVTLELNMKDNPDSPSFVRNLALVTLNNKTVPQHLTMYRDQVTSKMLVNLAFLQIPGSTSFYVWISAYDFKDADEVTMRHPGLLNGSSISFKRKNSSL